MKKKTRTLWFVSGAILLIGLFAASAILLLREEPPLSGGKKAPVNTEFSRPRLVGWSKGQKQWSLEADTMNDAGTEVALEKVDNGVIFRDEEVYLAFQAGQALWRKNVRGQQSSDLSLFGGVTVFRDEQPVLETERLEWQENEQLLIAPELVYFKYDGSQARASRLTINPHSEEVILDGEIDFSLEDGTLIVVQGSLVYNMKTGAFRVEGKQHFDMNL